MKKIIHSFLLLGLVLLLLTGATCPSRDVQNASRDTPEKTLNTFRQALENYKYTTAFECLSKNTRSRYPEEQFQMMLEWTVFGVLLKNLLVNWKVTDIKYDNNEATVTLRHYKYPLYQKDFIFVYEENDWRIDITIAGLLGVPQEDEDRLFSPHQK